MCSLDDAEPTDVYRDRTLRARKGHVCCKPGGATPAGPLLTFKRTELDQRDGGYVVDTIHLHTQCLALMREFEAGSGD